MKPIPLTETQMAELFRLRTENADYKQALEELGVTPEEARKGAERSREIHKMFVDLQTENEALRKDAERYRVLRDSEYQLNEDDPCVSDSFFNSYYGEELDTVVDELKSRFDAARGVK